MRYLWLASITTINTLVPKKSHEKRDRANKKAFKPRFEGKSAFASRPDEATRSPSRTLLSDFKSSASRQALLEGLHGLEVTDLRSEIENIKLPVLLLHAADDLVVPVAASRWLAQVLPNAELVEYPVGGHAFFIQHADAVAQRIGGML